jgi:hypothetical protein
VAAASLAAAILILAAVARAAVGDFCFMRQASRNCLRLLNVTLTKFLKV